MSCDGIRRNASIRYGRAYARLTVTGRGRRRRTTDGRNENAVRTERVCVVSVVVRARVCVRVPAADICPSPHPAPAPPPSPDRLVRFGPDDVLIIMLGGRRGDDPARSILFVSASSARPQFSRPLVTRRRRNNISRDGIIVVAG